MQSPPATRQFAPDLIRAFAIVGVLIIHLTYPIYARPDFLGGTTWWIAQILNAIFRISIPLFVMLSGYLLIEKDEVLGQTLNRTKQRLLTPLLFWSGFFWLWNAYFFHDQLNLGRFLSGFLSGSQGHLYFLFIMLSLYILLPVIRPFWRVAQLQIKFFAVCLGLLFGLSYYLLLYFHLRINEIDMFVLKGLPYLGYFLAGSLLGRLTFNQKQIKLVGVIWLLSTLLTTVLGYINLQLFSLGNTTFWGAVSYFDHYLSFNVMLSALAGFTFLRHARAFSHPSVWVRRPIELMARASFGLYVIHPMVMNILDRYFHWQVDFMVDSLPEYLVKRTLLVFVCGTSLVLFGQKIPILRKLLA